MKTDYSASLDGISQTLARERCSVCSSLIQCEVDLTENDRSVDLSHICNHHAWALAKAAPAQRAARIFIRLVESQDLPDDGPDRTCDLCARVQEEERITLEDMVTELKKPKVREWLRLQGTFCLAHSKRLARMVPDDLVELIAHVTVRSRAELLEDLRILLVRRAQGDRTGWGVLGRAAEFLTSQRGLTR